MYAPPKTENMNAHAPTDSTAPPESAKPDVQPRAMRAPYPMIAPQRKAKNQR